MREIKIFLSGSVKKEFTELNIGKRYWDSDEIELKSKLNFEVIFLNPNSISANKNDREGRFVTDVKMLLESDIVLVDGIKKKGIGVGAEMALAKNWKIPVYTIAPLESHYRKMDKNGNEWIHPFIYELSDRIFSNIDELASYLNELYKNDYFTGKKHVDTHNIIESYNSFDGGYDEGYRQTMGFWGSHPSEYVVRCAAFLEDKASTETVKCLDLGCGPGKNSMFLSEKGYNVEAWDVSSYAIKEAKEKSKDVNWKVRDLRKLYYDGTAKYDMIIMTGSLHCLSAKSEVESVIESAKSLTLQGGYHVLSVFNSTKQDLSGHQSSFHPILLSHQFYLDLYKGWEIIKVSNITQNDIHQHNGIMHYHSITRILARKT